MSDKPCDWMTPTEAANRAGVSPATIVKLANSGKIRSWKIPGGHHRRVSREDIEAMMRGELPCQKEVAS